MNVICKNYLHIFVDHSWNFVESRRAQVLAWMSSLCRTPNKEMTYELASCQRMSEKEVGDCSVLSIAFATAIANGIDPIYCYIESRAIRQHLLKCFTTNEITMFPYATQRLGKDSSWHAPYFAIAKEHNSGEQVIGISLSVKGVKIGFIGCVASLITLWILTTWFGTAITVSECQCVTYKL